MSKLKDLEEMSFKILNLIENLDSEIRADAGVSEIYSLMSLLVDGDYKDIEQLAQKERDKRKN